MYKDFISIVEEKSQNPSPEFWQISTAKNGEYTANENSIHLHSTYNPSREAQSVISSAKIWEKSTTVFYGFGLGYHVLEWAKNPNNKDKKLVLVEPDPLHFFYALTLLDWTEVFKIPQLIIPLACPTDQLISLLEDFSKINIGDSGVSDCYFFDLPAFTNHAQGYFEEVKTLVQRNIQKNQINSATLKKFGKLWVKNSLKNLDKIIQLDSIAGLKDSTKDLPFVIIGAGPSLQNLIPVLQDIKDRAVIVCVETALHTLLRNNIEPDFIILLDSQYWAYKHIAGLKAPSSILITEQSVYPAVFRFNCKKVLLCNSQFTVGQYFQNKLGLDFGDLGTGGSVACSAWNFAYFCGAKEIFLAGVDLGFPQKQTHIKGSSAEQTFHKISDRIKTAEYFGISSLFSAGAVTANDYFNNPLITDTRMKMFAWWFESRIANCPDSKTYTLCPEGLMIPGVSTYTMEDFLSKPAFSSEKDKFIKKAKQVSEISEETIEEFYKLKSSFPNKTDFLQSYPFLKEYF